MNIVIINNGYRSMIDRTRLDFFRKLARFPMINIHSYGPGEHAIDPEAAPLNCEETTPISEVINFFKPDLFLMFLYDASKIKYESVNLNKKTIGVPFVVVEEDHYREDREDGKKVRDWYKKVNFDIILRRHCYPEDQRVDNSIWFPFSANEEEFMENDQIERKNVIGFAGSSSDHIDYRVRQQALNILSINKLLDSNYGKFSGKDYIEYIQSHIANMACSGSSIHTPLAKHFEIPLCGTAVISNQIDHQDLLFDNKECYFEYKDDCSDVIEVVKEVLNNHDRVKEIVKNAQEQIILKHTDERRLIELINIFNAFIKGKELPRIWGQ